MRLFIRPFFGVFDFLFLSIRYIDERQKLYEEYTKASKDERTLMEKTYGKKQLNLMVESTLSEKYIEKESKPCPHCKVPIEVSLINESQCIQIINHY
jgi:hypothetical protein